MAHNAVSFMCLQKGLKLSNFDMTFSRPTISNRSIRRCCYALALTVGISGCASVGHDYISPPDIELPSTWNQHLEVNGAKSLHAESEVAWWGRFNDPLMAELVETVVEENLDLKVALSRVSQVKAQLGIVSSQHYPTVDLQGGSVREKTSANASIFPSRTDDYQSVATAFAWEIDVFGRISRQIEAAAASLSAAREGHRDLMVLMQAQVALNYIQLRTLQERLRIANENIATQRETLRIVDARFRNELTSELDVHQARQNLARFESVLPDLETALRLAKNRMAVLFGRLPGALDQQLNEASTLPNIPESISLAIPREWLRQRPDIRLAERQLAAQVASIGVAEGELYPKFSLSGSFGYTTLTGGLFLPDSNFWSFGPAFSWNIFDRGRAKARVALETEKAEEARLNYEKTVLSAFDEVETALVKYQNEQQKLESIKVSVRSARKTLSIAQSQYKNGLTDFQSVLDAHRLVFAEADRQVESEGTVLANLIDIYRAMGGYWVEDQPSSTEQRG